MKYSLLVLSALFCIGCTHKAEPVKTGLLSITPQYIEYENSPEAFCIAANGKAAPSWFHPKTGKESSAPQTTWGMTSGRYRTPSRRLCRAIHLLRNPS